jgi:tetratricopeptide (TPR) repeat protein
MFTQKRSLLIMMCGLLFGALILVACGRCCYNIDGTCPSGCSYCQVCPPVTPMPSPPVVTPDLAIPDWANQLEAGKNAEVVKETTEVIQAGKDTPQYTQALLYRGMAEFNLGDLESARNDLASAQELSGQMSNDEQFRLFRTQMVVLVKLGDQTGAEQAFQKALAIAPADQQDALRKEYENALQP